MWTSEGGNNVGERGSQGSVAPVCPDLAVGGNMEEEWEPCQAVKAGSEACRVFSQ